MNKNLRRILLILLVLTVLILTSEIILNRYLNKKLSRFETGNYKIESKEIDVSILRRKIGGTDVKLTTALPREKIHAGRLEIRQIKLLSAFLNKKYEAGDVHLEDVSIVLVDSLKRNFGGGEKTEIQLKNVTLSNADFLLLSARNPNDSVLWGSLSLEAGNLEFAGERELVGELQVSVKNAAWNLPGGLHKLEVRQLNFDSEQNELAIDSTDFFTRHTKAELAEITGVENDWYDISLNEFKVKNIETESLFRGEGFIAGKMELTGLTVEIFRDKLLPFPEKPDTKLPAAMIDSLPIAFHCDSLLLKNGQVIYLERVNTNFRDAEISFHELQASISNLSNVDSLVDAPTVLNASAKVMNRPMLTARFVFPNKKFNDAYTVSGALEPVELEVFNPMIVPNTSANIKSGRLKTFEFDYSYTNERSTGELTMEFENLGITFIGEDDGSKKSIKSFIANTFVIKDNNLKETRSYKPGKISFERHKKKSIFNYWWKSIFSGIESISIV